MNYQDTVNWMFKQLPMYQNQGKSAFKKDLSNTILLANHLENPEHKFKSIHVAGTNGRALNKELKSLTAVDADNTVLESKNKVIGTRPVPGNQAYLS